MWFKIIKNVPEKNVKAFVFNPSFNSAVKMKESIIIIFANIQILPGIYILQNIKNNSNRQRNPTHKIISKP